MANIKRGNTGSEVKEIQELLGITVDGDFGPATQKAVIDFQQKYNLTADGIVGPITLSTLKANQQTSSVGRYFLNPDPDISLNTAEVADGRILIALLIDENNPSLGWKIEIFDNQENFELTLEYPGVVLVDTAIQNAYLQLYPNGTPQPFIAGNLLTTQALEQVIVTPQTNRLNNAENAVKRNKSGLDPNQINEATTNDSKPKGLQRLGNLIVKLYLKLEDFFLPQLLALLESYAINQLNQAIVEGLSNTEKLKKDYCPTPERLEALIIQRNNLAGVLNNVGSQLDTISAGVNFSGQFSELLQALVNGLKGAEFILNQAAKLIPLIPGAIVSTVNDLGTIADVTLTLPDGTPIIPKIKSIVTSVAPPFALIQQIILQCVTLLDQLDELILLCAPNATLTPTSNTIDGIVTTQLIAEETETGNTYKGFTLEIETRAYTPKVDQNRAVGKNNFGIVMVFTDYSFASNPNVLIDELKFIIDRDNLKAY